MSSQKDSVLLSITVRKAAKQAFDGFSKQLSVWWPHAYTWSGEVLDVIKIQPSENGRCFERGPYNFKCDWKRVLEWKPPVRLVFSWQISSSRLPEPNPEKASEVDVQFVVQGDTKTKVKLEHRHFSRHGEGYEEYQKAMESEMG